jgi:hypothetical protein
MSKLLTFSEAIVRFGPLVTTGVLIEDAIQEAVDRVYEMGRWPGTTVQVELEDEDFVFDVDRVEYFLHFNEQTYNGMIGLRNQSRGWSIMDQTILFKNGVNGGDLAVVDMGTVTVDDVLVRKYRMPLGFSPTGGPYYVLMKLEAPVLTEDSIIPVESSGALKCAIRAVCAEFVGNDAEALSHWQSFDQFIKLSERQVHGPKKFNLGMDSSLRRKPRQFN